MSAEDLMSAAAAYVVTAVGVPAAITVAVASLILWLGREGLQEKVRASIKSEYDHRLEILKAELKASNDIELERQKQSLSLEAAKQSILYSNLHEKRSAAITEVYATLISAYDALRDYTKPFEPVGGSSREERARVLHEALKGLGDAFRPRRVFLPKQVADIVESILRELHVTGIDFSYAVDAQGETKRWLEIHKKIGGEIKLSIDSLEFELRKIMGDVG